MSGSMVLTWTLIAVLGMIMPGIDTMLVLRYALLAGRRAGAAGVVALLSDISCGRSPDSLPCWRHRGGLRLDPYRRSRLSERHGSLEVATLQPIADGSGATL